MDEGRTKSTVQGENFKKKKTKIRKNKQTIEQDKDPENIELSRSEEQTWHETLWAYYWWDVCACVCVCVCLWFNLDL